MKGKILILVLISLAIITCNKKNWDNPYDEEGNPDNFEKPEDFAASQINDSTIELTWSATNQDIDGLIIERKKTELSYIKVSDLINKELENWLDTDIEPNTEYFYRIYAVAGENTSDFSSTSITTKVNLPQVTILSIENITASSLICKCKIVNNGGTSISDKGICWNTSGNPTIYSNTKSSESGSDSFSIEISDLAPGTKYYFRAFAYNSKGRGYGAEKNATTKTTIPSVETLEITEITRTSLKSGGNITSTGGGEITSKGICWNKSGNPTINNNKTDDGSGNDDFISVADNLEMETIYYVRAFAMNKNGIGYGNIKNTSTLASETPKLSSIEVYNITSNSAVGESKIHDNGGTTILEKGVCWNTTGEPTVLNNKMTDNSNSEYIKCEIKKLQPFTKYYLRAYSTNNKGTGYSDNQITFFTLNETGTFVDLRDGQNYKWVKIGNQVWMAENLNYSSSSSLCYDNNSSNCEIYGRLYSYSVAQNVCPSGWHLPSDNEWKELEMYLGMSYSDANIWGQARPSGDVGLKLKSENGWANNGNGNNISGFNALPSGYREIDGQFTGLGTWTSFWSSGDYQFKRDLYYNLSYPQRGIYTSGTKYSVRCIKD
jgi:uncharacterized protein (TIGR02145 family)